MTAPPSRSGDRTGLAPSRRAALITCVTAAALFVVLAFLVGGHWGPLERLDAHTARRLNDFIAPRSGQTHAWRLVSDIINPAALRGLLLIAALALILRGDLRRALLCVATSIGSLVIVSAVKGVVDRPRPVVPDPVAYAPGASFPSGHALTSAAAALCMIALAWTTPRLRVPVVVLAALVALAVGFSRIVLGVHFVSDVVGGWLAATALVAGLLIALPEPGPDAVRDRATG